MLIRPGLRSGEPGFQGKGKKKDGKMALRGKKGEGVRRNEKGNRLKAEGGGERRKAGEQTGFEVTEFKATGGRDRWEERHTAAQQPSTFLCHMALCGFLFFFLILFLFF